MSVAIGIDLGTSSIKAALVEADGRILATAQAPEHGEHAISAPHPGWAEQDPREWWRLTQEALNTLRLKAPEAFAAAVCTGIAYQMHGLALVDANLEPTRPAIIWCDSRATESGERIAAELPDFPARTGSHPGNFTASKIRWVANHEPEALGQAASILLPGDYLASKLGAPVATTPSGLSEMMLWDFDRGAPYAEGQSATGANASQWPELLPTFGDQGGGITYRAGDQPNNALAMGVLQPGEVAATAGTSGVLFSVLPNLPSEPNQAANAFLHVNGTVGMLLCLNGAGSAYSWFRRTLAPGLTFPELNALAESAQALDLRMLPFGNGAERMLGQANPGASFAGIDFARHGLAELARATLDGVAFALAYGQLLSGSVTRVRAARANLFLCDLFAQTMANLLGATVERVEADGAVGAAMGALYGAGHADLNEITRTTRVDRVFEPDAAAGSDRERFDQWRSESFN